MVELNDKPPWTGNQLKRLGKAIRANREHEALEVSYDNVLLWYGELASVVESCIKRMEIVSATGITHLDVTSRPKTIHTLRDKLIAAPELQLPSVVDIAGVRIVSDMDLHQQDDLAKLVAAKLDQEFDQVISDTRRAPHSGYRALHLRVKLPAGRVEIQVRTSLQNAWANLYEALADVIGRQIRYGTLPSNPQDRRKVESAFRTSESLADVEEKKDALRTRRREQDNAYQVLQDSIVRVIDLLPESNVIERNEYAAKLEKCKIDWEAEIQKRKVDDSSNKNNDSELIRQMNSMEEDLRRTRQRGA
ncbi:hypothetical protein [Nocardia vaccinii]|uniref:hypothetical protein n=1 Tax=Nocardia vaccinii TaxID=1822 RepID=UPI000A025128|nr:hypothetical protein [Nocardia vaccinii]